MITNISCDFEGKNRFKEIKIGNPTDLYLRMIIKSILKVYFSMVKRPYWIFLVS